MGTIRFLNIYYENHYLEIGHIWIAKSFRRTAAINTKSKLLILQHAFENLNCIVVEIRTDILHIVSKRA
jgi:N-acetyltransferase